MPCNSDYMNPTAQEIQISRIACLLDELDGKKWTKDEWAGYHPSAYGMGDNKKKRDKMTKALCERLQRTDVTKYSLEMQMWWRDHQEADRQRQMKEIANGNLLVMYFDMEDMKWYFGAFDAKGYRWVENMRHSNLFNEAQVKDFRESLTDKEQKEFQVYQRVNLDE